MQDHHSEVYCSEATTSYTIYKNSAVNPSLEIPKKEPGLEREKMVAGLDKETFGFPCLHHNLISFDMWTEPSHFSAGMLK